MNMILRLLIVCFTITKSTLPTPMSYVIDELPQTPLSVMNGWVVRLQAVAIVVCTLSVCNVYLRLTLVSTDSITCSG